MFMMLFCVLIEVKEVLKALIASCLQFPAVASTIAVSVNKSCNLVMVFVNKSPKTNCFNYSEIGK